MRTNIHPARFRIQTLRRVIAVASLLMVGFIAGCGYPTVSRDAYDIGKALHAVVLQRDLSQLDKAEAYIDTALSEGRITAAEHGIFSTRLQEARAENWDKAAQELLAMLRDQNVEK